jgi:hypothetical protein
MTKRTRLFLTVSGGILVAGLGTGLVAAYVGGFQNLTLIGASGPNELAYVPSDARVVAYANVREIMDSELHQKLQSLHQSRNGDGLARFEAETGVDVTRDVDYVVAVLGGEGTVSGEHQGPPLVMARGRFDEVRVEGLVRSKGGVAEDYKGQRLFTYKDAAPDRNVTGVALTFLEPGLVAMGVDSAVRAAIDVRTGATASVTANEDLMRRVKEANADGNAWVVAKFDALVNGGKVPSDMLQRLPAINWVSVTGHVNGGVRAAMRAETRDETAAQNLRDVLQGILGLAKLQTGQRADLAAIVNSIELGGEGKNVSLAFAVPIEAIDQLANLAAARAAREPSVDAPAAPEAEPVPAP